MPSKESLAALFVSCFTDNIVDIATGMLASRAEVFAIRPDLIVTMNKNTVFGIPVPTDFIAPDDDTASCPSLWFHDIERPKGADGLQTFMADLPLGVTAQCMPEMDAQSQSSRTMWLTAAAALYISVWRYGVPKREPAAHTWSRVFNQLSRQPGSHPLFEPIRVERFYIDADTANDNLLPLVFNWLYEPDESQDGSYEFTLQHAAAIVGELLDTVIGHEIAADAIPYEDAGTYRHRLQVAMRSRMSSLVAKYIKQSQRQHGGDRRVHDSALVHLTYDYPDRMLDHAGVSSL